MAVVYDLTWMSLSVNSMTESAFLIVFQSFLSLMELTLAHSPCSREDRKLAELRQRLQRDQLEVMVVPEHSSAYVMRCLFQLTNCILRVYSFS